MVSIKEKKDHSSESPKGDKSKGAYTKIDVATSRSRPYGVLRQSSYTKKKGVKNFTKNINQGGQTLRRVSFCGSLTEGKLHGSTNDLISGNYDPDDGNFDSNFDDLVRVATGMKDPIVSDEQTYMSDKPNKSAIGKDLKNNSMESEKLSSVEIKNSKVGGNSRLSTSLISRKGRNRGRMNDQSSRSTSNHESNHFDNHKVPSKIDSAKSDNRLPPTNPFLEATGQKYSSHDEHDDEDLDIIDVYAMAASAVAAAAVDSHQDETDAPNEVAKKSRELSPSRFSNVTSQQSNLQWPSMYSENRMYTNASDSSEDDNNMTYGAIDRYMNTAGNSDTTNIETKKKLISVMDNKNDRSSYGFHSLNHESSYFSDGGPSIHTMNNYSSLEEEIGSSDESRNATVDVAASFDEIGDFLFDDHTNSNEKINFNEDDNSFHGHMILTDDDESSIEYYNPNLMKKSSTEQKFHKANIPKLLHETALLPKYENEEEVEPNQSVENNSIDLDFKKSDTSEINPEAESSLKLPDHDTQYHHPLVDITKSDPNLSSDTSPKKNHGLIKNIREETKLWTSGSRLREKVISWTPSMISTVGKHTRLRRQMNSTEDQDIGLSPNDFIEKLSSDSDNNSFSDYDSNSGQPEGYLPTMFLPDGQQSLNASATSRKPIPNSFYLSIFDPNIKENDVDSSQMQNFISEHRVFLRAVLQLLAERDRVGIVANADDPNTIKKGPLRKSNTKIASMWKVKYVEIRRGLFSYYENSLSEGKNGVLLRKNILLRSNFCKCRPLKMKPKSAIGYVFELSTESEPRRLWMTNSKSERLSWIEAIEKAMIGTSLSNEVQINARNDYKFTSSLSQFNDECKLFLEVRDQQRKAESKEEYLDSFSTLWGSTICIPLSWMLELDDKSSFRQNQSIKLSSTNYQSLKCISENDVIINGFTIQGNTSFATERIVGALCRCILEYDHISNNSSADTTEGDGELNRVSSSHQIDEFQAISFARDIILSCNKLRKENYGLVCTNQLIENSNFVKVNTCLNLDNPLKITVSLVNKNNMKPNFNLGASYSSCQEVSGWLTTRSKPGRNWKRRFFVLSGRILSYYTHENPRPHGLRGKLDLTHGSVESYHDNKLSSQSNGEKKLEIYVSIKDKSKERYFCFEDVSNFMLWKDAITAATKKSIDTQETADSSLSVNDYHKRRTIKFDESNKEYMLDLPDKSNVIRALAKNVTYPKPSPISLPNQRIKDTPPSHNLQNQISVDFIDNPPSHNNSLNKNKRKVKRKNKFHPSNKTNDRVQSNFQPYKQPEPTILVTLETCLVSKVCSCEASNNEEKDTLAMVQSKAAQKFFLSGGENGTIVKSDDLVELKFLKGLVLSDTFDLILSNKLGND